MPTPTIGGVGLLTISTCSMTIAFKAEGEAILFVGDTRGWFGQSLYLRDICGREEGAPPPVDLAAERRHGEFVRALIRDGLVTAVHDISDGGLLVALAEMAMVSHVGAVLEAPDGVRPTLFGSARIRPATSSRRRTRARSCNARSCRSAADADRRDRWPGSRRRRQRPLLVSELRERSEAGCRPTWLPRLIAWLHDPESGNRFSERSAPT